MGRNLDEIIAGLPPERQKRIEAQYQELKQEVESLRELRQIAGKAQISRPRSRSSNRPCPRSRNRLICIYRPCAITCARSAAIWNWWSSCPNVRPCAFSTSAMRLDA